MIGLSDSWHANTYQQKCPTSLKSWMVFEQTETTGQPDAHAGMTTPIHRYRSDKDKTEEFSSPATEAHHATSNKYANQSEFLCLT